VEANDFVREAVKKDRSSSERVLSLEGEGVYFPAVRSLISDCTICSLFISQQQLDL